MRVKTRLFVLVLIAAMAFVPLGASGQPKQGKRLVTETFFDMENVGGPNISPDGKQIIFTRGWVDKINDQSRSNVWLADIDARRIRHLSLGNWRDSSPVWSPDGRKIAFLSDRDGTNQVYVMWLDTREVAQLTHLERGASSLVWSPDGKRLAFTAFVPDENPILKVKMPERPEGAKWAAGAVLVDRLSWRADGRGWLPKGNTHIFVIDAELGGTPRQVTSGDYSHGGPAWSTDGGSIFRPSASRTPNTNRTTPRSMSWTRPHSKSRL